MLPFSRQEAWELGFNINGTFGCKSNFNVPEFYSIIENNVLCHVSVVIDVDEVRRVARRLGLEAVRVPFGNQLAFYMLMDILHSDHSFNNNLQLNFDDIIPKGVEIDFCLRDDINSGEIFAAWCEFGIRTSSSGRRRPMFREPWFGNPSTSLGLQAAHFWTWWVRRAFEEGRVDNIKNCHFQLWRAGGAWKGDKMIPGVIISYDEKNLEDILNLNLLT